MRTIVPNVSRTQCVSSGNEVVKQQDSRIQVELEDDLREAHQRNFIIAVSTTAIATLSISPRTELSKMARV